MQKKRTKHLGTSRESRQNNLFSVLNDEEVGREEKYVVFTDTSSNDHRPKGTLS